jgi:hypothetical protein
MSNDKTGSKAILDAVTPEVREGILENLETLGVKPLDRNTKRGEQLDAKLCEALSHVADGDQSYRGYLAATVTECIEGLICGDASAPEKALRTLNLPLHQAERMTASFAHVEAATWVRAAAWFLEVARDVATSNAISMSPIEQRVLEGLMSAEPKPLRAPEILERIPGEPPLTEIEVGQTLTLCHEKAWVVCLRWSYRLSARGREVLRIARFQAAKEKVFATHSELFRQLAEDEATVNPEARAAEKQASRDQDAKDLASGVKTRDQLWEENTLLPASRTSVDVSKILIPE